MPSLPGAFRRLVPALAAAAVTAAPLLPATAQAAEPAGSTVVGELVQAWPEVAEGEAAGHAEEQPLTWVETAGGDSVRIPTDAAGELPVGATVEVTVGGQVDDAAARPGIEPARELIAGEVVAEEAPAAAPGEDATNEVTVVLVAPRGVAHDAVRPEQVAAAVDGPVADFWSGQTRGAVDLRVAATYDWVDTTAGCGKPSLLWDQAAAAVGFTPGPGKHLLLYLSSAAPDNCAYGLAEIGTGLASGGRAYVRDALPSLIAHELGHNLGLGHSSALHCADGAEAGACATAPYRDLYDVMGASWDQVGALNAVQSAALGLLDGPARRTVRAGGAATSVRLAPLSGTDGVRGVRLLGRGAEYWLELRTATGQDGWLGTGADAYGLQSGVLVRRLGEWPDASLLLDPTPGSGREGDYQVAVPVGRTVELAGGFAVTVASVGPSAVVRISSTDAVPGDLPEKPAAAAAAPDVLPAEDDAADVPAPAADAPAPAGRPAAASSAAPAPGPGVVEPRADAPARPHVVPASQSRSLALPLAAGGALAGAALLVGVQLVRTRVRR